VYALARMDVSFGPQEIAFIFPSCTKICCRGGFPGYLKNAIVRLALGGSGSYEAALLDGNKIELIITELVLIKKKPFSLFAYTDREVFYRSTAVFHRHYYILQPCRFFLSLSLVCPR
jgi:hypothetical protein